MEMPMKCSVVDVVIIALTLLIAHRLTNEVMSHQEIGEDVLDGQLDEIVWAFYEDWQSKKPDNFMSAMKDLGRLFDENDPNEMLLRLHNRLQVHRQNVKQERDSMKHVWSADTESPPKQVRNTKKDI